MIGRPGIRRPGDRPDPDADPPDLDPDLEHLGQPGALHRGRVLQRRGRPGAVVGAFWLALVGAAIAGVLYPLLFGRAEEPADRPVRDAALER